MSMSIRDLHDQLGLLGTTKFLLSRMSGGVTNNKRSLTRPVYIETLLKHSFFPKHFGESFDEIMSPNYAIEDAKTNIRISEYNRTNPEAALLSVRADIQYHDILILMEEAKEWIETKDKSYKYQKSLEHFRKGFQEYFEKGDAYEYSWDRIVTALKTFFDEELLVGHRGPEQLRRRYNTIASMIDAEHPLINEHDLQKKLMKEMDDLQWYFDNFCVGSTLIEGVLDSTAESLEPLPSLAPSTLLPTETPIGAVYVFDGKLMALPDGAVYLNSRKINDIEPCVGQTLYALLSKKVGYVSYLNIAHAIYGEHSKEPSQGRQAAIRKYVSRLRTILKRYYPASAVENERGKGWTFVENVKGKIAVA